MCPLSKTGEKTPLQSLPEHDLRRPDRFPIDRQISARISRSTVGIVIASGLVFFYFGSLPIWHTDVWGHLNYGRDIWENHSLPTSEPRLPFAREMPFVDSAWLSQLIGYTVVRTRSLGLAGLQGLLARRHRQLCSSGLLNVSPDAKWLVFDLVRPLFSDHESFTADGLATATCGAGLLHPDFDTRRSPPEFWH